MAAIHLIERADEIYPINMKDKLWESRAWHLNEETVKNLIGADLYFHRYQDKESFFGGKIVGYEVVTQGPDTGRINLHFIFSQEYKNVSTSKDGWGYEKKIVW